MNRILLSVIAFLLVSPFLVLLSLTSSWRLALDQETLSVFLMTFAQAAASAGASLIAGLLGALGLLWVAHEKGRRAARVVEAITLLPNIAPVLILLLAVIKFFPFARGFTGIVFAHALLNTGLVAAMIVHLVHEKVSGMAELAWIEGASRRRFLLRGALPALRGDLATLFLFVFVLCFTSFAIPLMLGGSRATTVEVLIWQKIRISGDWGEALGLATLQTAAVIGMSFLLRRETESPADFKVSNAPLLSWKWGLVFALAPALVMMAGLCTSFATGVRRLLALPALLDELPKLMAGSLLVGTGTGALCGLYLLALAYLNPQGTVRRLLLGYVAPSSVLTGFALLVAWRATGFATYVKIILGLTLILAPSFYRLRWDAALRALDGQRVLAWSLGASERLVFEKVVFPQVIQIACHLSGLAALWAWGDFALSAVVGERAVTLAMAIQGLMESYRLDAATSLIWLMMVGGALTFALFNGVGNVLGTKSQT